MAKRVNSTEFRALVAQAAKLPVEVVAAVQKAEEQVLIASVLMGAKVYFGPTGRLGFFTLQKLPPRKRYDISAGDGSLKEYGERLVLKFTEHRDDPDKEEEEGASDDTL